MTVRKDKQLVLTSKLVPPHALGPIPLVPTQGHHCRNPPLGSPFYSSSWNHYHPATNMLSFSDLKKINFKTCVQNQSLSDSICCCTIPFLQFWPKFTLFRGCSPQIALGEGKLPHGQTQGQRSVLPLALSSIRHILSFWPLCTFSVCYQVTPSVVSSLLNFLSPSFITPPRSIRTSQSSVLSLHAPGFVQSPWAMYPWPPCF